MDVLAHRGLHGPATPENTVRAVLAAVTAGADGVEVDLRVTGDGVVVLSHDADLLRLTGRSVAVEATAWPVLRDAAAAGGVTLARLTDVLPALATCRRVILEVKTPDTRGPAPRYDRRDRAARAVAGELSVLLCGLAATRVTVSSFDEDLLCRVRAELSGPRTPGFALLGAGVETADLVRRATIAGWDEVHTCFPDLRAAPLPLDRPPGGPELVAWTVEHTADLRWCETQNASAVIAEGAALRWRRPAPTRARAARALAYSEAARNGLSRP